MSDVVDEPHTDEVTWSSEGPPLDELAYTQASRALDQQAGVLDELRQRTSTLIAVSALVATFLGGKGLGARAADQGPEAVLAAALLALFIGVGACLLVLSVTRTVPRRRLGPRHRWRREEPSQDQSDGRSGGEPPAAADVKALAFSMNVEEMLRRADERNEEVPMTRRLDVARTLQLAWDENSSIVAGKQRMFQTACGALMIQTACWISYIAMGKDVI